MEDLEQIQRQLDKLYADLAELRRHIITRSLSDGPQRETAWDDLFQASEEISALWTGPDAVDEIRAQREK